MSNKLLFPYARVGAKVCACVALLILECLILSFFIADCAPVNFIPYVYSWMCLSCVLYIVCYICGIWKKIRMGNRLISTVVRTLTAILIFIGYAFVLAPMVAWYHPTCGLWSFLSYTFVWNGIAFSAWLMFNHTLTVKVYDLKLAILLDFLLLINIFVLACAKIAS